MRNAAKKKGGGGGGGPGGMGERPRIGAAPRRKSVRGLRGCARASAQDGSVAGTGEGRRAIAAGRSGTFFVVVIGGGGPAPEGDRAPHHQGGAPRERARTWAGHLEGPAHRVNHGEEPEGDAQLPGGRRGTGFGGGRAGAGTAARKACRRRRRGCGRSIFRAAPFRKVRSCV